jgi:adenylate kinase family enzyme
MRASIEGNMASGKSLFARHLAKALEVPHLSMDAMRSKAWANGVKGGHARETTARSMMLEAIKRHRDGFILERSGTSEFDQVMDRFFVAEKIELPRVLIDCRPSVCVARMESRPDHRAYPLPDWMGDPEPYIYKVADRLHDASCADRYRVKIDNSRQKQLSEIREEVEMIAGVVRVVG